MDALGWLRLQLEWGADEALDDQPVDRRVIAPALPAAPQPTPAQRMPAVPTGTPPARAEVLAQAAATPDALLAALASFDGCALSTTATSTVFRDGDPASRIVLVADVPGAAEDRAGLPFAGPAAALLGRMLGSIGLQPDSLLATSLLPWRPPGDRRPSEGEVAACLPFLLRHLRLIEPRIVLLFGALGSRTLLPGDGRRVRPGWQALAVPGLTDPIPALSFSSLSHISATASAKRDAWHNLLLLKASLAGASA